LDRAPILKARLIIFTTTLMILIGSSIEAQSRGKGQNNWIPPGLSVTEQAKWINGRPPGWSRGEKQGWENTNMPPGLAKKGKIPPGLAKKTPSELAYWSNETEYEWEQNLEDQKRDIYNMANSIEDFSQEDLENAIGSLEASARSGVPPGYVGSIIRKAMKKGYKGRGFETTTKALSYGVGKGTNFNKLNKFVHKKLDQNYKGDDLSIEIYKEIAKHNKKKGRGNK